MKLKVLKFGGSSVQSPERIRMVQEIVQHEAGKYRLIVVVSAFGGVTDYLINIANKAEHQDLTYLALQKELRKRHVEAVSMLISEQQKEEVMTRVGAMMDELSDILHGVYLVRELTGKTLDYVMSFGERLSAYIISYSFSALGVDARYADMRKLIRTDDHFGNAAVNYELTKKLLKDHFSGNNELFIVPGFIAGTENYETTTLGRGGSDYTASIIASSLGAEVLEIWTDVDGMMTIDPRKVRKAYPIPRLSYSEALELSHFGAKVIYPPTVQPVFQQNIPIRIKNTFSPSSEGTLISKDAPASSGMIRGISSIDDTALLTLHGSGMIGVTGVAMRLFGALARNSINVILISQGSSEHSITAAVNPADAKKAGRVIEEEFSREIQSRQVDRVEVENDMSIIAIVGEDMKKTPGIAGRLFSALGKNGINIMAIAQGSSEINISLVIDKKNLAKACNVIHDSFFLSEIRDLNLFIAGIGTVGKTLLQQLFEQKTYLLEKHHLNMNIAGLCNSQKSLLREDGIDLSGWTEEFQSKSERSSIENFASEMISMNLPNSIFIDCSASELVASVYKEVLDHSISVVTANKIAASGPLDAYKELRETAAKRGVRFIYETNVGAGLPVIGTLNDLIRSGDKVYRIEAVLSGTLNYIFNNYSETKSFSETVKEALEAGFTEPDPRLDLSGVDVARKILILARECGKAMEIEEVNIGAILPDTCMHASDMNAFWMELRKIDQSFEVNRKELAEKSLKLRYVAVFEEGRAYTELQEINSAHPFYSLEGKDNIVLYTTARYNPQPLVVRGAGAGAAVTSAGVFADIIRIANL